MSGWCPSFLVCGMAVVCAAAVLPGAVVWLVPRSSHCSAGEYCCHVMLLFLAGCVVCVGECVSVVFVWWGILCPPSPSSWWWVGLSWMVGWHSGWWVAWWVKGGSVTDSPSNVGVPRLCVGVPLVVYSVAVLNGGSGVCCAAPCLDWVWHLALCRSSFTLSVPFVSFLFLFCLVLLCLLWVGKCGGVQWGTVSRSALLCSSVFVFAVTALLV